MFSVTPRFNALAAKPKANIAYDFRHPFTITPVKIAPPVSSSVKFGKISFHTFAAGGRGGGAANGTATPAIPDIGSGGLTPSPMMLSDQKLAELTYKPKSTTTVSTNTLLIIGAAIVLLVLVT